MPKVIGIAGQVGAGKSLVLQTLNVLYGIPLFDCDKIAKESYFIPSVREEIIDRFGVDPIKGNGELAKEGISKLLANKQTKEELERIVHGTVREQFGLWKGKQASKWVALESAILFTSNMYQLCDVTIAVKAETPIRMSRVLKRDPFRSEKGFELLENLQRKETTRQNDEADWHLDNSGNSSIIRELEVIYHQLDNIIHHKQ